MSITYLNESTSKVILRNPDGTKSTFVCENPTVETFIESGFFDGGHFVTRCTNLPKVIREYNNLRQAFHHEQMGQKKADLLLLAKQYFDVILLLQGREDNQEKMSFYNQCWRNRITFLNYRVETDCTMILEKPNEFIGRRNADRSCKKTAGES